MTISPGVGGINDYFGNESMIILAGCGGDNFSGAGKRKKCLVGT